MIKKFRNKNSELNNLFLLTKNMDKNTSILDVGCGVGNKIEELTRLGFKNITGVDINNKNVQIVNEKGFNALSVTDFEQKYHGKKFDLIVFSHIVEHFQYNDLKIFIENYLQYLKSNSFVYISTPTLHRGFYDDFDHVKPYSHLSFLTMFSHHHRQIQFQSKYNFDLIDIYFRKSPYTIRFNRFLCKGKTSVLVLGINTILKLLFVVSGNEIGETTGWQGIFKVTLENEN